MASGASVARKDGQSVEGKLQAGADGAKETEQQRPGEEVVERWRRSDKWGPDT